MADKILTLHPEGKKGVKIDGEKYQIIRDTIVAILEKQPEITYQEINRQAIIQLKDHFKGSISWYVVTVKLDLEARGIIERIPKTNPHRIRLSRLYTQNRFRNNG
jgi:hypothetical protein